MSTISHSALMDNPDRVTHKPITQVSWIYASWKIHSDLSPYPNLRLKISTKNNF